jgi:hypothetical protein
MLPDEVARLALENITNGPVYIPSAQAIFEQLLAMPRRDALTAMAGNIKKDGKFVPILAKFEWNPLMNRICIETILRAQGKRKLEAYP